MIIDKVKPFWTDEDRQRLEEIRKKQEEYFTKAQEERERTNQPTPGIMEEWLEWFNKEDALRAEVESRYIAASSKKKILADIKEIVAAIEKEDYLYAISRNIDALAVSARQQKYDTMNPIQFAVAPETKEGYGSCYNFIFRVLWLQINVFSDDETDGEYRNKIKRIISDKVSRWYAKPQPSYMAIYHGKATDAFAYMNNKNAEIDTQTNSSKIEKNGVFLEIAGRRDIKQNGEIEQLPPPILSINTDKLYSYATALFTAQNRSEVRRLDVSFPLKDFARLLGYEVDERETTTPEETAQEKKRAKTQIDNARKVVRKELDTLQSCRLVWEEKAKGKDYDGVSPIIGTHLHNGEITIDFHPGMAAYLINRPITQYNTKLFRLDPRKSTAYYIGRRLAIHHNMDNNQIKGTADRIGIPSILKVANLVDYEELQQSTDRGHWEERIKEPIEKALDELTKEKIIKDWEYAHPKGIPLTDEEASNITSYEEYTKLFLLFTFVDEVDNTKRMENKEAAKEKQQKKQQKKR